MTGSDDESDDSSSASEGYGRGGLENISEQLSRIQAMQEKALLQKDRELELLKSRLEQQNRQLFEKDIEIRHLERQRYQQQEERVLELRTLVGARGASSSHTTNNPYQGQNSSDGSIFQSAARICHQCFPSSLPRSSTSTRPPLRMIDLIHCAILFVLVFHFYMLFQMQPQFRQFEESASSVVSHSQSSNHQDYPVDPISIPKTEPLKPWQSIPPKSIALMKTYDPFIQRRHTCIRATRERQKTIFEQVLLLGKDDDENKKLQILLVDPAYHTNVGDHMLTLGELELIQGTLKRPAPQQCHYIQANNFYEKCTNVVRASGDRGDTNKVALWHAGGNWGDLWRDAQDVRIPSIKTILENGYKVIGLPQSLFYLDESLKRRDVISIREKVALGLGLAKEKDEDDVDVSRRRRLVALWEAAGKGAGETDDWDTVTISAPKPVNTSALDTKEGIELARSKTILMWREQDSFEEASRLYPFVTNMAVPDMAFQLGPYAPIRKHPKLLVDVIVFLRNDKESKVNSERNEDSIRRILPKPDLTFKIVDWSDRLNIFETTDTFFTDTSIELLSLGKVVVCDRLHAAVLAYLTGLPFVYIDQVSGKISKTLTTAFDGAEGCLDGEQTHWARAMSLQEALAKASDMIDKHGLNHGQVSFLRGLIPF